VPGWCAGIGVAFSAEPVDLAPPSGPGPVAVRRLLGGCVVPIRVRQAL